jgi:fluoroacetyl-CoA thioesterase
MPVDASLVGLCHSATLLVDESLTVPEVSRHFAGFRDMPPVFATAFLVGFIEATCIEALAPWLDAGQGSVGTYVDISHVAATPAGMIVTAEVELIGVEGRSLHFRVSARDERDLIGEGEHRRAIIDRGRFIAKVQEKAGG